MKPAIQAESLSKKFQLGTRSFEKYRTLRETIINKTRTHLNRVRSLVAIPANETTNKKFFWALKNVSFDVQPGEVVGIIGRNGSGKSTLLKILSRIYEPTNGRAIVRGRLASLLEVGTGFHHELTGRENIYLNGSILGMTKKEINRRFDEIVAFSEIEQFLDTPVKRYSSGMYVRLAFAIAAHLEPEILIIDEVLAVGDGIFQKKCLGKMGEVARGGRTVIFVSHNMSAVQNLCHKVLILNSGNVAYVGDTCEGISRYSRSNVISENANIDLANHPNRAVGSRPLIRSIRLLNKFNELTSRFHCGEQMIIELLVDPFKDHSEYQFGISVEDAYGTRLFMLLTKLNKSPLPPIFGPTRVICLVDQLTLAPGNYSLTINGGPIYQADSDHIDQAIQFTVVESNFYGNGVSPNSAWGTFLVRSQWTTQNA
jgi:lipopolysaccharide transport system ATP-binding protein